MGWSIGEHRGRDIGYGVPAECDHPECSASIDRGLSFVCGGEPYGGEYGCGLFFCQQHLYTAGQRRKYAPVCKRCLHGSLPFEAKPDVPEWVSHKLTHESWQQWRDENPQLVQKLTEQS